MRELLDVLASPNGENVAGVILSLVFWGGILAVVAMTVWRRHRRTEIEAALQQQVLNLKLQMIERGMSADEIERVLAAGPSGLTGAYSARGLPPAETVSNCGAKQYA